MVEDEIPSLTGDAETADKLGSEYGDAEQHILGNLALSDASPEETSKRRELAKKNLDSVFSFFNQLPKPRRLEHIGYGFITTPELIRPLQSSGVWDYYGTKANRSIRIPLGRPRKKPSEPNSETYFSYQYIIGHNLTNSSLLLVSDVWDKPSAYQFKVDQGTMKAALELPYLMHLDFSDRELQEMSFNNKVNYMYRPPEAGLVMLTGSAQKNLKLDLNNNLLSRQAIHMLSNEDLLKYHVSEHLEHLAAAFKLHTQFATLIEASREEKDQAGLEPK